MGIFKYHLLQRTFCLELSLFLTMCHFIIKFRNINIIFVIICAHSSIHMYTKEVISCVISFFASKIWFKTLLYPPGSPFLLRYPLSLGNFPHEKIVDLFPLGHDGITINLRSIVKYHTHARPHVKNTDTDERPYRTRTRTRMMVAKMGVNFAAHRRDGHWIGWRWFATWLGFLVYLTSIKKIA